MSDKEKNKEKKINIEIDEKISEGIYSNLAIINHSISELMHSYKVKFSK